jgi:hypothetical protein
LNLFWPLFPGSQFDSVLKVEAVGQGEPRIRGGGYRNQAHWVSATVRRVLITKGTSSWIVGIF